MEFAQRFAGAWARPTPEGLVSLLHVDIVLLQPHLPPIRGKAAALNEMRRLLRAAPEIHGEIERARGNDGVVFIEWRMKLTREHKGIHAVDRFLLQDGLALEREVFFDQFALMAALGKRPRLWPGFLRYRFGA
jgi:hypothetical protein